MFGDLFSQRGDYAQGLLYAGRRTFLRQDDPVEPPKEFKTKRQAQRAISSERERMNQKVGQKLDGQKPDPFNLVFENLRKDGKILQKAAKSSLDKRLVIEKFSTTDKDAWKEKNLAGCKIWCVLEILLTNRLFYLVKDMIIYSVVGRVNESTGEVSQECPWLPLSRETSAAEARDKTQTKASNEKEFGTGSLVYEDKELNELLVMLDASQTKKK